MKPDELELLLARDQVLGWLRPWRNAFLTLLASLGMKLKTVKDYARAVDWSCTEVERRGAKPNDMNGAILVQLQCALPTRLSASGRRHWKSLLARFINYPVEQHAIAAAPQSRVPVPAACPLDTSGVSTPMVLSGRLLSWTRMHRFAARFPAPRVSLGCRRFLRMRVLPTAPEIARRVCEAFGFRDDLGALRRTSCLASLRALESAGLVRLPEAERGGGDGVLARLGAPVPFRWTFPSGRG